MSAKQEIEQLQRRLRAAEEEARALRSNYGRAADLLAELRGELRDGLARCSDWVRAAILAFEWSDRPEGRQ